MQMDADKCCFLFVYDTRSESVEQYGYVDLFSPRFIINQVNYPFYNDITFE